jgi:hypothetical protein
LTRRRRLAFVAATFAAGVAAHGCSAILGIDGDYADLPPGGSDADTSTEAGDGALDAGDADGASPSCDGSPGACVGGLPAGFELVLFATDRVTPCPAAFTQHDVVADPVAGAGACDCSCTVAAEASCTVGRMSTWHSTDTSCLQPGVFLDLNGSGCTVLNGNFSDYFSATPLPADVPCNASAVVNSANVTSTALRLCDVPSTCQEEVCGGGGVPAGLSACIASDGDVACPAGWDAKTLVGDSPDVSCTACTCTGSGSCTDGNMSFFSDNACSTPLIEFTIDDSCQATNRVGPIGSLTYTAALADAACTADGPKTATVALTAPRTICCK